jgi:hypothetical protein
VLMGAGLQVRWVGTTPWRCSDKHQRALAVQVKVRTSMKVVRERRRCGNEVCR